jgi:hypothetical protein
MKRFPNSMWPGRIDFLESMAGLLKRLQIRALAENGKMHAYEELSLNVIQQYLSKPFSSLFFLMRHQL